jgi:hypothetical protein
MSANGDILRHARHIARLHKSAGTIDNGYGGNAKQH